MWHNLFFVKQKTAYELRISDWSSDVCSSDLDDELTGLAGLDFGWQLSPAIKLTQAASTIVGETTTSTSSLTALNAKLSGGLSARIAYSAALDTHPPTGVERFDTMTRFPLVYGF